MNDYYQIDVPSIPNSGLTTEIAASSGDTTEIYVTQIPPGVSVGSSIGIGTETLEVLKYVIKIFLGWKEVFRQLAMP